MPELRHLRAFVALADEGSFTAAARRLNLAQQAVSKTVAQLEAELGTPLVLRRAPQPFRLTPAGEALASSGRQALRLADAAFREAQQLGDERSTTIRIALSSAVGARVRRCCVRALREWHPDWRLSVRDVSRASDLWPELERGDVDFALTRVTPPDGQPCLSLPATTAEVHVSAYHALAGTSGAVDGPVLRGSRLQAWNGPEHPYTRVLVDALAAVGVEVADVSLAPITGLNDPPTFASADEVALLPIGWPVGEGATTLELRRAPVLPLWLVWSGDRPPASSDVVRRALQEPVAL